MFSVYLIHDNPLIRVFYWKNVLRYIDPSSSVSILFFGVCSSLLILIVSILIDIFRQELFTKISGLIKK